MKNFFRAVGISIMLFFGLVVICATLFWKPVVFFPLWVILGTAALIKDDLDFWEVK